MDTGPEGRSLVTRIYGGVSERVGNRCTLLIVTTACLVALVLAGGFAVALCLGHAPSPSGMSAFGAAASGSGVTAFVAYLATGRNDPNRSAAPGVTDPSRTDRTGTGEGPGTGPAPTGRSCRTPTPPDTTPGATEPALGAHRPPGDRRSPPATQTPAKTP